VGWGLLLIGAETVALWLLMRLKAGKLFLMALSTDAPASAIEKQEAAVAAVRYQWLALVVISVMWALMMFGASRPENRFSSWSEFGQFVRRYRWIWVLFVIGTLADLISTLVFFHRDGVDHELHPGIRLVSYALGRSVGPVVTKVIQFAGVLLIASLSRRVLPYLVACAGALYLLGAIYNVWVGMN
jgi:hypothetical protein